MKKLNVGLDIDGVLCNFAAGAVSRAHNMGFGDQFPKTYQDTTYWGMSPVFSEVMKEAWMDPDFWLALPKLCESVPFIPRCYITSRPIATKVTQKWLINNGFPEAEVISVKRPSEKLAHIQSRGLDLFVDDYYVTVQELVNAGVNALLYKAAYQCGHVEECKNLPTIHSLDEVLEMFKEAAGGVN